MDEHRHEHDHVLPDGTTVRLRAIRPDDDDLLLQMWDRLSPETIRYRFLGAFKLTANNVHRFTDLDTSRQFAFVATLGRGEEERIVGVCRFERLPEEPEEAEFAVLVEDAHQGRGIGTAMLRHLVLVAQEDGIERLSGDILAENYRMLRLMKELGLSYERTPEGITVHTAFRLEPTERFLDAVASDEKRAAAAALARFFRPQRVAVVGASRDPTTIGGLVFANILNGGFQGVVYPVNPAAAAVQSVASYPSLSDLPETPDLVVVCVPAAIVNDVVDEAGKLGVRAVCIVSAGFAEAGDAGRERQRDLLERARAHGLRIVGPNCMGLLNAAADVRLNGTFSQTFPAAGRLSFSSQSGALGLAVLDHVERLGLGISTFVSVGNKADISGNDLLLYWEDDPATDVILLYLESFGNPRKFARLARRISYRKPIVAVKSGRTTAGRRAASSHTAALAAGDVAVDALFRQTGVIRTDSLEELFDVAGLLVSQPLPRGRRVGIITNAGGPGILCADACESQGLVVPPFTGATRERLREFLPAEAGFDNPVDMIASGTAEQYGAAIRVLGQADEIDAIIVIFIPPIVTQAEDVAHEVVAAAAELPEDKPILSVFMGARGVPEALAAARIPSYVFPEDAARALGRVANYAGWRSTPSGEVVRPADADRDLGRAIVDRVLGGDGAAVDAPAELVGSTHRPVEVESADPGDGTWVEADVAQELLTAYGVPFARTLVARTPEEAAEAQQAIGAAVALKLAAPIHKNDVGGLRLGLETPEDVAAAVTAIRGDLQSRGLGQYAKSFLVQEMVGEGIEMVVGVTHDPSFGPLLLAGFGGTLVELLQDVSVRVTPVTNVDVDEMLRSLRAYRLLAGYRGAAPADVDALHDLLFRLNAMVEDLPEVAELDLNPVIVGEHGAKVVDVRLRLATVGDEPAPGPL
ncbi:MAG: GNAT family N-acetyltransferase [Nitriliruptorales bacterium]